VAVPIFDSIIHAVWANVASKTELAAPSPEAERQLSCKSIDLESGDIRTGRGRGFSECFRVNAKGKVVDTQYLLLSGKSAELEQGKSTRIVLRSTSAAWTPSLSRPVSGRLRTFSPQGMPRSRWVAARPLGNLAFAPDWNAPHPYTALVLTTEGPTPQRAESPSPVPSESGKSTGTLSQSKSGARAPSPETAEDRLRKIMQICRGC
ncbi:MAG: hypothetical protein WAM17_01760, partial [Rhodoplanes sp.]